MQALEQSIAVGEGRQLRPHDQYGFAGGRNEAEVSNRRIDQDYGGALMQRMKKACQVVGILRGGARQDAQRRLGADHAHACAALGDQLFYIGRASPALEQIRARLCVEKPRRTVAPTRSVEHEDVVALLRQCNREVGGDRGTPGARRGRGDRNGAQAALIQQLAQARGLVEEQLGHGWNLKRWARRPAPD